MSYIEFDSITSGAQSGLRMGRSIGNHLQKGIMAFALPLILCTQMLTRQRMGERYLTAGRGFLAILLVLAATWFTGLTAHVPWNELDRGFRYMGDDYYGGHATLSYWIGGIWAVALFVRLVIHQHLDIPRSRNAATYWHSRSDGVGNFRWQTPLLEVLILIGLAVLAESLNLHGFCALLVCSAWATFAVDVRQRQAHLDAVLNEIDSRIEDTVLVQAIAERLGPAEASGLNASLPANVSDEFRKKVAALLQQTSNLPDAKR